LDVLHFTAAHDTHNFRQAGVAALRIVLQHVLLLLLLLNERLIV